MIDVDLNLDGVENEATALLTVNSAASVSKGDIEQLENKIKVLEKQISRI